MKERNKSREYSSHSTKAKKSASRAPAGPYLEQLENPLRVRKRGKYRPHLEKTAWKGEGKKD